MEVISTEKAPLPIGPYSQAIKCGNFLFVSGQLGIDPATGKLISDEFAQQAVQALKNIGAIIEASGLSVKNAVKFEIFLTDIEDFQEFNKIYSDFLGQESTPARQVVEVSRLPLEAKIEISCVCFKK